MISNLQYMFSSPVLFWKRRLRHLFLFVTDLRSGGPSSLFLGKKERLIAGQFVTIFLMKG